MYSREEIREKVNNFIAQLKYERAPLALYEPITYTLSQGGKRIRPVAFLMAYNLFKEDIETALYPAVAMEVYHNYTLIHDDVMDKATIRRGQPTVWTKWGENEAILSGDTMFVLAYEFLAHVDSDKLPAALALFNEMAKEIGEGQQYDMEFENMQQVPMEAYMKMIGLKTAVLIACAAKMGAIIGGASLEQCELLYKYGYDLGLAFQVADDWLDTFGDPKVFGKAIGGDILNNKKTWLMIKALDKASEAEQKALHQALEMPMETEQQKAEKIAAVIKIYESLGIKEEAKQEIIRLHEQALGYVAQLGLSDEAVTPLHNYATALIGRNK